jgi:hypothetical protein
MMGFLLAFVVHSYSQFVLLALVLYERQQHDFVLVDQYYQGEYEQNVQVYDVVALPVPVVLIFAQRQLVEECSALNCIRRQHKEKN